MSSDYDIEMSLNDTLELDAIIEKTTRASSVVSVKIGESYDLDGFSTHTAVFNPKESGDYKLNVNGQILEIKVINPDSIPTTIIDNFEDGDIITLDSNWDGWKGNTGDIKIQESKVLEGSKTAKFKVTDIGHQIQTEATTATKDNVVFWILADGDTGGASDGNGWYIRFNRNVGTFIGGIEFVDSSGNVNWNGTEVMNSWETNKLYKIRFEWNWSSDSVDIIINGSNLGSYNFKNSVDSLVEIEHRNNTYLNGTRSTYIDNIGLY